MKCPKCGSQNEDNAKLCYRCYSLLRTVQDRKEATPANAPRQSVVERFVNQPKCKECGCIVTKKADKCPNCGGSLKRTLSRTSKYLLGIIGLSFIVFIAIISSLDKGSHKIDDEKKKVEEVTTKGSEKAMPGEKLPDNIYLKWVDREGKVHYTQEIEAIPEEYRSKVEKMDVSREGFGKARKDEGNAGGILGSTKREVMEMFKGWRRNFRYEKNVDPRGLKFENQDLMVVLMFDSQERADGVAFLSQDVSDPTGKTSYVNRNYERLVNWATGGRKERIENNKGTPYPNEVYIGNMPY